MESEEKFKSVYERLREIMRRHEADLVVKADEEGNYYLDAPIADRERKKPVYFGGVQTKKNYVSYHLMPVYVFPDLLEGVSEKLRKRMQGKSCFNFTAVDNETVRELESLTERGVERFREAGYI
jgi:hypothetical protein